MPISYFNIQNDLTSEEVEKTIIENEWCKE